MRREQEAIRQEQTLEGALDESERYDQIRTGKRKRMYSQTFNDGRSDDDYGEQKEKARKIENQEEQIPKAPEKKEGFMDKVEKLNLEQNADKLLGAAATANKFLSMFSKLGG